MAGEIPIQYIQISPFLTWGVNCIFQISHRTEKSWWKATPKVLRCQSPRSGVLHHDGRAARTWAPAVEWSEARGCSQEQSAPQVRLPLSTSLCCWPLLDMGCCWVDLCSVQCSHAWGFVVYVVRYVTAWHSMAQQFSEVGEANYEVQMRWFCFFRTELLKITKSKPSDKERQYRCLLILFVWRFGLWGFSGIVMFHRTFHLHLCCVFLEKMILLKNRFSVVVNQIHLFQWLSLQSMKGQLCLSSL